MRFLLLSVASAQPFYKDTLRQLPEKLRQERIHATVDQEVIHIQRKLIEEASANQTSINFTLYCLDPNLHYRDTEKRMTYPSVTFTNEPLYTFPSYGAYYLYQRDGPRYRFSEQYEYQSRTELIFPIPYCHAKHGYELYQRTHGQLQDTPQAYATLFFQKLNQLFPDINLAVSNERPSEGLYDSDCCPLFTVSW